jgi:hypothetical protein
MIDESLANLVGGALTISANDINMYIYLTLFNKEALSKL